MKEMKRLLAIVLCFVMLVGYLPTGAAATQTEPAAETVAVEETVPATTEAETVPEETEEETVPETTEAETVPEETEEETVPETTEAETVPEETEEETVPETTEAETVPEETEEETIPPVVEEELIPQETEEAVDPMGQVQTQAVADPGEYVAAAIFFSDLHAGKTSSSYYKLDYKESTVKNVMTAAYNTGLKFSTVTSVGDLFAVNGNNDTGAADSTYLTYEEADKDIIGGYIQSVLGSDVVVNYTWSDHDRTSDIPNVTGLIYGDNGTATTADDAAYYIYAISHSDMSTSGRYGVASTFTDDKLQDFSDTMARLDHSKPVFIATHQPLHAKRGDNQHAYDWYEVITAAAANQDIVVLWGHNHNYDAADYYYYGVGDTMTIQNGSSTKTVTDINFTQIGTGYLSPTTSNNYTRTGVIVVAKLLADKIVFTTYDANGVYAGTTNKPGLVDKEVTRAHAVQAPTSNTVTEFDDFGLISVTATAVGLTEEGTSVTNVTSEQNLDDLFYGYWALDVELGGYESGEVAYSVLLDKEMDPTNLELYYIDGDQRIPVEFEIVTHEENVMQSQYLEFTYEGDGIFVYGEGRAPAGYELTDITIENVPALYFVGQELNLSDAKITATYTMEGAEDFIRHLTVYDWDGCFSGFNINTPGVQTVTFEYEGVVKTFEVEYYPRTITWSPDEEGETVVTIAPSVPGVTLKSAEDNTDTEFVQVAMNGLLETYVAYDIKLNGFGEGDTAEVTLPVPAGVTKPAVFYVPEDGSAPVNMNAVLSEDGKTVTFTTDHFSTYVVGDNVSIVVPDPEDGSFEDVVVPGEDVTNVYYILDTNGLDVGETYLIVNSNSTGNNRYAMNSSAGRTGVTVSSGNVDGNAGNETYITVNNTALEWVVGGTSGAYTFKNGNNYIRNNRGTLQVSATNSNNTWSWDVSNNRLKSTVSNYTNYSLYYRTNNSNFVLRNGNYSVYLYKRTEVTTSTSTTIKGGTYSVVGNPATILNDTVKSGDTATLNATVSFRENGSNNATTVTPRSVTYAVVENGDPNNVITLSGNTVTYTGNTGTALVKVTATGYHNNDSSKPYEATNYILITAKEPVYGVTITTPASTTIKTGSELDLEAVTTQNGIPNGAAVTWTSSDPEVAEVDENGVVTAKKPGEVTITATYASPKGDKTAVIHLKVEDPTYSLEVNASKDQVKVGGFLELEAIAARDGEAMEGQTITWTTSDESLATVDANGKVTGVKMGTVTITATWTDPAGVEHKVETPLNVVEAVWALSLDRPVLDENGNHVYATDADGNQLLDDEGKPYYQTTPINSTIVIKDVVENETYENVWAVITRDGVNIGNLNEEELGNLTFISSNPGIATVDDKTGLVTFKGAKGTAAITAIYTYADGKSVTDTILFSVSPDHFYVPEDGTGDFPEYPNQGAIRFDKTATAVGNFSQTGITQVELSMTGVPYGRGVDIVVVIDTSSSMKKDKDGNDLTYGNANSRYGIMKASLEDMLKTFGGTDENGNRHDIDLAIVDFNGYSSSPSNSNSNNSIPGANLNDSSTDRTGANKGRVYTGNGNGAYILNTTLGANHFENTGAEAFNTSRISTILNYFDGGSSGTNYDFGIQSAYQLLAAKQAANKAAGVSRDQYVIFLTDGAPFRYNGFTCDNSTGRLYMDRVLDGYYADSAELLAAYPNYGMTQQVAAMYNPVNGTHPHRMAEAIKGIPGQDYLVVEANATTYVQDGVDTGSYLKPYKGLGAKFYSIGFCIADDDYGDRTGVVHEATSYEVIRTLSSGAGYYWEDVESKDELSGAFSTIAKSIIDAAKDVKVVDTMGDKFTMVFDIPNSGVQEALAGTGYEGNNPFYIEIKDYTLIPVDENGNTLPADSDQIADFKRGTAKSLIKLYMGLKDGKYYAASNSAGTEFASPVFDTNPIGSKRYWTTTPNDSGIAVPVGNTTYYFVKDGTGTHNMASGAYALGEPTTETVTVNVETDNGITTEQIQHTMCNDLIIATPYFTYNAATKEMVWTVEKLATSELAMSYFLYLDNSGGFAGSPSEIPADTYTTNKAAYLYYTNFNGVECEQTFPVPQMTWNGAQVSYVFYLVNEYGQPVNRAGTVVPFSEAVYVTDVNTYSIIWNRLEQSAGLEAQHLAHELVPDVYRLYDEDAAYRIHVYENEKYVNLNNHFAIEGSADVNTTYVFNTKADATKYRVPGTYVADNKDANTGASSMDYLCKSYEVTGSYEAIPDDNGDIIGYKVTSATYTGTAVQWTPGSDDSTTGGTLIGGHAYYVDAEGKIYTIVSKKDGNEVYAGFDFSNTTVAFAVVWLPQLKEDTVVMDFGLDVVVDVIANDNMAAGVVGVRTDRRPVDMNSGSYGPLNNDQFQNTVDISRDNVVIGKAVVENQNAVRFALDKKNGMLFSDPIVFYYEAAVNVRDRNGVLSTQNMYSSVTVIPATTVYYEDEYVTLKTYNREFTEASGVTADTFAKGTYYTREGEIYIKATKFDEKATYYTAGGYTVKNGWMVNSNHATATQAVDRPGIGKIGAGYDADNIYGYDAAYAKCSTYSMENAAMTQVINGNNYATAQFSFYGTGFDVISMTSDKTGSIVVQVAGPKNVNYMVDTYFGYKYENDQWVPDENAATSLYQVPVIKVEDLPYGKYTVTISASHADLFDHEQYDGTMYDFYLDAIRIYNPAGTTSEQMGEIVENAYAADGELLPNYYELRNLLIDGTLVKNLTEDQIVEGVVFIDGNKALDDTNASLGDAVSDYTNYGPNNEVYLAPGQAVAFHLDASAEQEDIPAGYVVDQVHLAYKSLGGTAKLKVYDASITGAHVDAVTVDTATDLYYDMTKLDGKTVVISNAGSAEDALLSITNIKVTYTSMETVDEAKASLEKYLNWLTAQKLMMDNYELDSWKAYSDAVAAAESVIANTGASLDAVKTAYTNLKNAYIALVMAQTAEVGVFSVSKNSTNLALMSLFKKNLEIVPVEPMPQETEAEEMESLTAEPEATESQTTQTQTTQTQETKPTESKPAQTKPNKGGTKTEPAVPVVDVTQKTEEVKDSIRKAVGFINDALSRWL